MTMSCKTHRICWTLYVDIGPLSSKHQHEHPEHFIDSYRSPHGQYLSQDRHYQLPIQDPSRSSVQHARRKASHAKPIPSWLVSALPPQDDHRNDPQDDCLPPSSPIQSSPPGRASDVDKKSVLPHSVASSARTKKSPFSSPIISNYVSSPPESPSSKNVSTSACLPSSPQKRKDPYAREDPDPDEAWSTLPVRKKGKTQ